MAFALWSVYTSEISRLDFTVHDLVNCGLLPKKKLKGERKSRAGNTLLWYVLLLKPLNTNWGNGSIWAGWSISASESWLVFTTLACPTASWDVFFPLLSLCISCNHRSTCTPLFCQDTKKILNFINMVMKCLSWAQEICIYKVNDSRFYLSLQKG